MGETGGLRPCNPLQRLHLHSQGEGSHPRRGRWREARPGSVSHAALGAGGGLSEPVTSLPLPNAWGSTNLRPASPWLPPIQQWMGRGERRNVDPASRPRGAPDVDPFGQSPSPISTLHHPESPDHGQVARHSPEAEAEARRQPASPRSASPGFPLALTASLPAARPASLGTPWGLLCLRKV